MEYALQAVKLGTTAIGIRTKDGVVLAAEKRITSKLMEPTSVEKIMEVRLARIQVGSTGNFFRSLSSENERTNKGKGKEKKAIDCTHVFLKLAVVLVRVPG